MWTVKSLVNVVLLYFCLSCQDVIHMDDDEGGILPDPAEKFEELLTR